MNEELVISVSESAAHAGAAIRCNTHGYLPHAVKRVTVPVGMGGSAPEGGRIIETKTGKEVWCGRFGPAVDTGETDTHEKVAALDFTALSAEGSYELEIEELGCSIDFRISGTVWNEPYRLVTRAMYLWRCGCAVRGEWRGKIYAHGICHCDDGYLDYVGGAKGSRRDATGGWHDAGDFNKYVVNAGVSVGLMFRAWEHFRGRIETVSLDLPESGNGTPDLLNELRYEFDWLFKMQFEDGRVSHKLTAKTFDYRDVPEGDTDRRYFCPWGTAATACFVAMMALGARHFKEFDAAYAKRCLAAARLSWACLRAHPEHVEPDQSAFATGGYGANDASHRLWAAAEMWESTGEAEFLADFEKRAKGYEFNPRGPVWHDVEDLALGVYLESSRTEQRDAALVARLGDSLFSRVAVAVAEAERNPHGRPLGGAKETWEWGGNGRVAGQTYQLHLADRLRPNPAYRQAAQQALAYLFGRNFHGRSYVTGLGANPPENPHDRRGGAWPGYLVGGPWPTGRDWFDVEPDYRTNEIAINWNAALIYALAAFVEGEAPSGGVGAKSAEDVLLRVGNDALVAGVTPGCGGRTVLLRTPDGENLLQAQPERWREQATNTVAPAHDAPWEQDAGQVVWAAPQSRFWADQTLSDDSLLTTQCWPPDPFLTLAPFVNGEQSQRRLVLRGPHSPVSQLTLMKSWSALEDGRIRFEAEAKNTGVRPVRKGLWFNLRAIPSARVYVPVASVGKVRRTGDAGVPVRYVDGFVEIGLPRLKPGQDRADEKFFVEPSRGMIVAAVPGGFLVLEFTPTAPEQTAEGQAPVEIYRLAERNGPGLLELEQHGPACELSPGDTMRHAETWRFVPWPEGREGGFPTAFLRAWCGKI
jgi:endoglucanase